MIDSLTVFLREIQAGNSEMNKIGTKMNIHFRLMPIYIFGYIYIPKKRLSSKPFS